MVLALGLAPLAVQGSDIMVKRGQAKVDPALLPLICLEIATDGIQLPVDSVIFTNLDTYVDVKKTVAQSFNASHPDLLTAVAPGAVSLSLAILQLPPGHYEIKSVDFVTGGAAYLTMAVSASASCNFVVTPGCVSYLGGIEFAADWDIALRSLRGRRENNVVRRSTFRSSVTINVSGRRDAKWACEVDPGMLALPAALAQLRNN